MPVAMSRTARAVACACAAEEAAVAASRTKWMKDAVLADADDDDEEEKEEEEEEEEDVEDDEDDEDDDDDDDDDDDRAPELDHILARNSSNYFDRSRVTFLIFSYRKSDLLGTFCWKEKSSKRF